MSFGYSVGDFLGVLKLAIDLSTALSETRGVSVELQRLSAGLESLQKAIKNAIQAAKEWGLAYPNSSNKDTLNALAEEHSICKRLLENFWKASEKYTQSIINGKGSKVKREWAKIKWCMFHSDDAVALERNLEMHVKAINIYSCELRCRILRDIAASNSSELTVMGRGINTNTVALKDVSISVQRLERLLQSIQNSILKYAVQRPTAGLVSPEAPLILLDALGRELDVPIYLTGTIDIFHGFLELIYKSQPGHDKILRQEYLLADEDSGGALITMDNWTQVVKPGMSISLSMVFRKSSVRERACPRCDILCKGPLLFGQRLRCPSCQVTFQVFTEERVIELPEKPPIVRRDPTTKRAPALSSSLARHYNNATTSPTAKMQNRPLRSEDVFQRIHIVREITQIKGRGPNTNNFYMRGIFPSSKIEYKGIIVEAVEGGDVEKLKAILDTSKKYEFRKDSYLTIAAMNMLPRPVFELLIAAGEDINTADELDLAPLQITCQWSTEISALLMANGARVNTAPSIFHTPPLYEVGCPEIAQQLISHGADVNSSKLSGQTPLMEASVRGLEEVARHLIENGADVEAKDYNDGKTPLSYAKTEGVTRLLLEFGADPNNLDYEKMTPLHYSRCGGIARVLIEHGIDVNARSATGETPLHTAWHSDVAKVLLENGATVNSTDHSGRTPLHTAAKLESFFHDGSRVARILVEHGAEVNSRDSVGRTPLHMAENSAVAKVLLENGADVNATDVSGLTPIHAVCLAYYEPGVVRILLENGAEVNGRDSDGRTPLHMAGNPEAANVLLENGADVNAADVFSRTPMHAYACSESAEFSESAEVDSTAHVLLKNGAEVNARDSDGQIPLHMAKLSSRAKVLLDNSADVNATDVFGRTPLHATVSRNHDRFEYDMEGEETIDRFKNDIEVTRVLLKNGAEVNARDLDGQTPLQRANRHCRDILIKFKADVHDVKSSDQSSDSLTGL